MFWLTFRQFGPVLLTNIFLRNRVKYMPDLFLFTIFNESVFPFQWFCIRIVITISWIRLPTEFGYPKLNLGVDVFIFLFTEKAKHLSSTIISERYSFLGLL